MIFAGEDVAGVVVRPAFGACVPGCRTLQRVEEKSVSKQVSSLVAVDVSVGEAVVGCSLHTEVLLLWQARGFDNRVKLLWVDVELGGRGKLD